MSTARAAWREVREGVDQGAFLLSLFELPLKSSTEAQSRAAFIQSLTLEIINPLTALKVRVVYAGLAPLSHRITGNSGKDSQADS